VQPSLSAISPDLPLYQAILLRQAASECDRFASPYTIWGVFGEDLPHIDSLTIVLKAYRVLNSYKRLLSLVENSLVEAAALSMVPKLRGY
jgi:hypothetical protein